MRLIDTARPGFKEHSDRKTAIPGFKENSQHIWRAQIVLLSADGVGTNEIMRTTGTSKTCVGRWQRRFMEAGMEGLLVDKTRPLQYSTAG